MIEKYRDISIINFGDELLTVACDSCGGVGMLEYDTVHTDGFNVGYHTTFVSLAETLAIGAKPFLVIDTLSVSLDRYGKSILYGIKAAVEEAGMDPATAVTGSSEENFKVKSTGIGVTVLGRLNNHKFKPIPTDASYEAIVVGLPVVGNELLENKTKILTLDIITLLKNNPKVLDLIPVGSKGILYESNQLATDIGMSFNETVENPDIIRKSAGPASCAVIAGKPGTLEELINLTDIPVFSIGQFTRNI